MIGSIQGLSRIRNGTLIKPRRFVFEVVGSNPAFALDGECAVLPGPPRAKNKRRGERSLHKCSEMSHFLVRLVGARSFAPIADFREMLRVRIPALSFSAMVLAKNHSSN